MNAQLPADHLIGANNPPLAALLAADNEQLLTVAKSWIEAGSRLPEEIALDDAEAHAKVSDYVRGNRTQAAKVNEARDAAKRPYDNAAKEVQGFFKPFLERLAERKAKAEALLTGYNNRLAERQRKAMAEAAIKQREEADRIQAAAAKLESEGHGVVGEAVFEHAENAERGAQQMERMATAPVADLVRMNSGSGVTSARTAWAFEVTDVATLRRTFGALGDHFAAPAIDTAIRSFQAAEKRAGRTPKLPGVTFRVDNKAFVR